MKKAIMIVLAMVCSLIVVGNVGAEETILNLNGERSLGGALPIQLSPIQVQYEGILVGRVSWVTPAGRIDVSETPRFIRGRRDLVYLFLPKRHPCRSELRVKVEYLSSEHFWFSVVESEEINDVVRGYDPSSNLTEPAEIGGLNGQPTRITEHEVEVRMSEELPIPVVDKGLNGFMVLQENFITPEDGESFHKQFLWANFLNIYGNVGAGIKVDSKWQKDFLQIRPSVFLSLGSFQPSLMLSTASNGEDYLVPEIVYFWKMWGFESLLDVAWYHGIGGVEDNFLDVFFHTRRPVVGKLSVSFGTFYDVWENGQKQWMVGPGVIWSFTENLRVLVRYSVDYTENDGVRARCNNTRAQLEWDF